MQKVYLDFSIISALFDDTNPRKQALTTSFFNQIENFDLYISNITFEQITQIPEKELRKKIKNRVSKFSVLYSNDKVELLANKYLQSSAILKDQTELTHHIAIAVINEIDIFLSWNFRPVIRRITKDRINMVNGANQLKFIEFWSPPEILGNIKGLVYKT